MIKATALENTKAKSSPITPFFGGFILETLTLGMYEESRNAIREYVQNSFDSICLARESELLGKDEGEIQVILRDDGITIRDNGVGMRSDSAAGFLTSIGASRKDYRKQAGFRGIGRLSGLVLCNTLLFRTKAKGDHLQTTVTFNAEGLRDDLRPSNAQSMSLEELLVEHITVTQEDAAIKDEHFFEVSLNGLYEPPAECLNMDLMADFLGEVAPVRYGEEFPYRARIDDEATRRGNPIEAVKVTVHHNDQEREVTKPYGEKFLIGSVTVPLTNIDVVESSSQYWWGWVSEKELPGTFAGKEAGIRIRVRNIQIDGTELMRDIFSRSPDARSYTRFNEWYLGEIFITHDDLIPNARRDGFEENKAWLAAREELIVVAKRLGSAAYKLSARNQVSMNTLVGEMRELERQRETLKQANTPDLDAAIRFSKTAESLQKKIGKGIKLSAQHEEMSQLRRLETRLITARTEVLAKFGGSSVERVAAARDAAQEMLERIVLLLNERLEPKVNSIVMGILEEEFGASVRRRR